MIPDIRINGDVNHKILECFNLTIKGVDAEVLLHSLPEIAFSTGSACSAFNISPSHVLLAQGLGPIDIQSTIRLSLGRFTTVDEARYAVAAIKKAINQLRRQ
jgi:cysteine desulfurase